MVRPRRERLSGRVGADEIYVGGKELGTCGQSLGKRAVVAGAVEENGADMGRGRLQRVPTTAAAGVEDFPLEAIEPGSTTGTLGGAALGRRSCVTATTRRSWAGTESGSRGCFPECGVSRPYFSAGCRGRTKARRSTGTWNTT